MKQVTTIEQEKESKKMTGIEKTIRNILADSVRDNANYRDIPIKEFQMIFAPNIKGEMLYCAYFFAQKTNEEKINVDDFIEVSYQDISGIWYIAMKPVIEQYIGRLFVSINEREHIDFENIKIVINATSDDPTFNDLEATLYNGSEKVRELEVSEFVE